MATDSQESTRPLRNKAQQGSDMSQATQEDGALFLEVTLELGECLPRQDTSCDPHSMH